MKLSHIARLILMALMLAGSAATPAHAATVAGGGAGGTAQSGTQVTWQQLNAPNDWAGGVINELFPINLTGQQTGLQAAQGTGIGNEQTVIGTMMGLFNGIVGLIAAAWFAYATLMEIHRGSETGEVLSERTSSWVAPRIAMAAIFIIPIAGGFNVGQAAVVQIAQWGVGMADLVYDAGLNALGPGSLPIVAPVVPNAQRIVAGMVQDEACRDLINDVAGTTSNPIVPVPTPIFKSSSYGSEWGIPSNIGSMISKIPYIGPSMDSFINPSFGTGGTLIYPFSAVAGDGSGSPVCGEITLRTPAPNSGSAQNATANIASDQEAALDKVYYGDIEPQVGTIMSTYFQTANPASLSGLMNVMTTATSDYSSALAKDAATVVQDEGQSTIQTQNLDQMKALGWSGAGAYFIQIAAMNGRNLGILDNTATISPPSWGGLPNDIKSDLSQYMPPVQSFLDEMQMDANVDAGDTPPTALLSNRPSSSGLGIINTVFDAIGINRRLLNFMATAVLPTNGEWADPFVPMINLGQHMVEAGLSAIGVASLLHSKVGTLAAIGGQAAVGDEAGAAATAALAISGVLGRLMEFIYIVAIALMFQGLMLAYVIPMVPLALWIAQVINWLILVCEGVVAVPVFLLAHMTYRGDGFHGANAGYGYKMLLNILLRPVIMLFGLMLSYFIFTAGSWLIFNLFSLAADFVFNQGNVVTNLLGLMVLVSMMVVMLTTLAILSFRMISMVTNIMRWGNLEPAERVDGMQFARDGTFGGAAKATNWVAGNAPFELGYSGTGYMAPGNGRGKGMTPGGMLPYNNPKPGGSGGGAGAAADADTTLAANTEVIPPAP